MKGLIKNNSCLLCFLLFNLTFSVLATPAGINETQRIAFIQQLEKSSNANFNFQQRSSNPTFSISYTALQKNKALITRGSPVLLNALDDLKKEANEAFSKPFRSVIEKKKVAGINDKHAFVSMGPYWWPDTTKKDGLPYIRRDGITNPEVREISDKTYLNELSDLIEKLSLAFYYTGDERYAQNAIQRLRVWFVSDSTKMNPNLNHGQYIPGRSAGRAEGIIDTRVLLPIIDGIQLLKASEEWSTEDDQKITGWFSNFLNWLENSDIGVRASKLENNIGTAYYMQVMSINLFLGKNEVVLRYCQNQLPDLLDKQLDDRGVQHHEVRRTNSWNYSLLNLNYWFNIANMAEFVNVDLWNYRTSSNKSLRQAFEYMLPYALNQKQWHETQLRNVDFGRSFNNIYRISRGKFRSGIFRIVKRYRSYEDVSRHNDIKGMSLLLYDNTN